MDDLSEHAPLSGIDEYLIHNHPNPVRVMSTTDPRAYERLWFGLHDEGGEVAVALGLAQYPNLDTAEAFIIVTERGITRSVRAHRRLGLDRSDMTVGPFSFEVVRPFREWRLTIGDNVIGIAADIRCFDRTRAVYHSTPHPLTAGAQQIRTNGYETMVSAEGWIDIGDRRIELSRTHVRGSRDHHWGIRDGVGGQGMYQGLTWPLSGAWVQFDDWALWGRRILFDLGDERPGSINLAERRHRLAFEPGTDLISHGEIDIHLPDATVRTIRIERIAHQILPLRLGMYGGANGGTPEGDVWHGTETEEVVAGEVHDLNDVDVRMRVRGLDDVQCRFEYEGQSVVGFLEVYHGVCKEACERAQPGYALLG